MLSPRITLHDGTVIWQGMFGNVYQRGDGLTPEGDPQNKLVSVYALYEMLKTEVKAREAAERND